jgi:PRTRC genetic system protein C
MSDSTSPTRRIFVYGDHTFDDPGPAYTPEQVRVHLAAFFPELARATTEEKPLPDGALQITFRKQITTKGAFAADDSDYRRLAGQLAQLPPYADPLQAAILALGVEAGSSRPAGSARPAFTYEKLLLHHDHLRPAADAGDEEAKGRLETIARCLQIPPIPLTAVPLGY